MDALMAALVAALLAQASDRTPWIAARIARQFDRPGAVIAAAVLALAISNAIGAGIGAVMAPILTPNARALLLGLALLSAGATALLPLKPIGKPGGQRLGAFTTAFVTLLAAGLGGGTQFLAAAIAARHDLPVFAAIGATLGAAAVQVGAIMAGDDRHPFAPRAIRIAIGVAFAVTGTVALASALRLI